MTHPRCPARRVVSFFLLTALVGLLSSCDGRQPKEDRARTRGHLAVVNLSMGAPESPMSDSFFPRPAADSFLGLVRTLTRIEHGEETRGVFVALRSATLPFAQAKEVGDALGRIRAKSLPIVCHTHEVDNATMWMFSKGCTEIWVSAAGSVPTVGIGAELAYLKGAFDKLGVVPQMLAFGRYKSGGEALTRTEPSEPSLDNLQNTLFDLRSQWLTGISEGRPDGETRKQKVEDGPYSPPRAVELGLIDRTGFEDQALLRAKELAQTQRTQELFGSSGGDDSESPAAAIVRLLSGADDREKNKSHIAVVPAVGAITMSSEGPFAGGEGITAASMTRTLERLRKDKAVKAIVIRMDSPGGSPLASDLIWQEVMLARNEKPVVVSIGGMSASGGYYIASAATKIVASPTAIVGSIGVFGGKIVLGPALEKMGITHYPVPASPHEGAAARAGHLSPFTKWDAATEERMRESMQRIYDLFVERVAQGRALPKEQIYGTAEGEIFLATVGQERGLIDELGGLKRALDIARGLAKVPDSIPVVLEGATESLFESLLLGPEPGAQEVKAALDRFERKRLEASTGWALGNGWRALLPFEAVVAPLLAGENIVAALPFALQVR